MSAPKLQEQREAKLLRKRGYSINEISQKLNVSKGSVSVWVRDILLSQKAKDRLKMKKREGQKAAQKALRKKKNKRLAQSRKRALSILKNVKNSNDTDKVLCAMIYWCEGAKDDSRVDFSNSDPRLVVTFLHLLRKCFDVEEEKFRVCIHLHSYHNKSSQIRFWSKVTNISQDQFTKPYQKKNSGPETRKNYQGCVNIRYHDASLAQDIHAIAREYMNGSIG